MASSEGRSRAFEAGRPTVDDEATGEPSVSLVATAPAVILAATVAALIAWQTPGNLAASVATVAVYVGTAGGPAVAIPAGMALNLPLLFVVTLLWLVDVAFALFFALAVPVEYVKKRVPRIGRKLDAFHDKVRNGRFARWGVLGGIIVWVGLPFHSGGAIVGTVAGRAFGLSAATTITTVSASAAVRMTLWTLIVTGVITVVPFV